MNGALRGAAHGLARGIAWGLVVLAAFATLGLWLVNQA